MDMIEEQMAHVCRTNEIEATILDTVGSTNDYAAGRNLPHGAIVAAVNQTAGRGQRGNRWSAAPGENLTVSIVLRPTFLPAAEQFLLSQAVALAVADTLAAYGLSPEVKWPNDIYIGDKKIAGILIENDVMGAYLGRSIAGIGLNVNQRRFDPSLPNPTSVAIETGREYDVAETLAILHDNTMRRCAALEAAECADIEAQYDSRLYRKGVRRRYRTPDGATFYGVIEGVMPGGELVIRRDDGSRDGYLFKEVEYIL